MSKIDFKKKLKHLYQPSAKKFMVINVPPMNFLMIDGHGDPNSAQEYKDAVSTLYPVAYALKFMSKRELDQDYVVPPLEGLWWVDNMEDFSIDDKSAWDWTMMIMQPEWITDERLAIAKQRVQKKNLPSLAYMRLASYDESTAVQIMHIGPYADEVSTIARMHDFAYEQGYQLSGKHHEIYLSDPNRIAPEKLKTVLRQPIVLS